MLSQPIQSVVVLSRGSDWNPPSILPLVGDTFPAGSTAYCVFYNSAGATVANVAGTVTPGAVDFSVQNNIVDVVPAGAMFEKFLVTPDGRPHKIRYGVVFRKEARFPNAPGNTQTAPALAFSDTLQRTALGTNWVPINGTSQLYSNAAIADVQTVAVGAASAGTFTLTFNGQTTAAIAYNAAASAVLSALTALPNISSSTNVAVAGTGPWTVTFQGTLGGPQPVMTINGSGLTGGSPTVTHTTTGVAPTYGASAAAGTSSAIRWYAPFNTDTVSVNVNMLNIGAGFGQASSE